MKGSIGLGTDILNNGRMKTDESICREVIKKSEAIIVTDIEKDNRFLRKNKDSYKTKSFISVPIKLDDQVIGVMNVADKHSDNGRIFSSTVWCDGGR